MISIIKRITACLFLLLAISCRNEDKKIEDDGLKPEDNRFTPVTVTPEGSLREPMVFEVLPNETAYVIERHGTLKKIDLVTKTVTQLASMPVFTENEQGLVGFTIDPDFANNHWIYLYYAHPVESKFVMSRWDLVNDSLIQNSEKILFEIPCDRGNTSHTGGGMTWDANRNLYITIGNNTGNSLYSQTDQRPDRKNFDDQRGAANTNDLRGKILRIHPEPDGTYTIPEGNLFPQGTAKTRPEIYIMGNRNPWRISVDSKTGFIYWGEIGPDADSDTENGPMGYDELNQAKKPGFAGWPYFIGENRAYPMYDYAQNRPGPKQDTQKPINNSVNNTGLNELPPAVPAFIAYPYRSSEKYPLVGSSSRCAIGGPIYHRSDFKKPKRPYPSYYEGKWLAADLSRFWIMAITMDENGNYKGMERFLPDYHPQQPIDIKFGPDGDLYVLEYGSNTANSAIESRLVRIEYNAGNRKPAVKISADKRGGALPLTIDLNSKGSRDFDGDKLTYEWTIGEEGKEPLETLNTENARVTLDKPGVYIASLKVTDDKGESNAEEIKITAGNEPPQVQLNISGNQHFFFPGNTVQYNVKVADNEDGTLADGKIKPEQVAVSIDYASAGFDYVDITLGHSSVDALTRHAVAETMISRSDCKTCHLVDKDGVGPSFTAISDRYKSKADAYKYLADKIINGSSGAWKKETSMPAHPTISEADAQTIAQYILNITNKKTLPVSGSFRTAVPENDDGRGTYIFRAAYTDRPVDNVPSLSSESVIILRSPIVFAVDADTVRGVIRDHLDEYTFMTARPNSYLAFKNIDMTDLAKVKFIPNWHLYDIYKGGNIEVRLDKPDGELIGECEMQPGQFNMRYRGAFGGLDDAKKREEVKKLNLPPLNERAFFAPGTDKNDYTIPATAKLKPVQGRHDLFFVFKNQDAQKDEALFPLARVQFSN